MSKYRYAAKIDKNQSAIVGALRKIPGVSVQVGMDDMLVGYKKQNYWFELKEPETVSKKTQQVLESKIKPSQHKLLKNWTGHYSIVWNIDQILTEIGIQGCE